MYYSWSINWWSLRFLSNTVYSGWFDLTATEDLAPTINSTSTLTDSDRENLLKEFTKDDILEAAKRSPNQSSPGIDGLPYQILFYIFHNQSALDIAVQVYNDALKNSMFPSSWTKTCMILLPKKGDLKQLSNHHPISLINTDAKLFTRLLQI